MKNIRFLFIVIVFISCNSGDTLPDIGNHYRLHYTPTNSICLFNKKPKSKSDYAIPGHILFYGVDSEFIVIEQKNSDGTKYFGNLDFDQRRRRVYQSESCQYWIIKMENDSVYGPYQKEEYLLKRKELNVKKKLDKSTLQYYTKGQREDRQYINPDSEIVDIRNLKGNNFTQMKFPFAFFNR
jgi:hypothetical protein